MTIIQAGRFKSVRVVDKETPGASPGVRPASTSEDTPHPLSFFGIPVIVSEAVPRDAVILVLPNK